MAILAECPICHVKQSVHNRLCPCGENLVKAKQSKRVRYWISYRLLGKQRRESVGYSIEEARDAEGKRRSQKRENRIFDIVPEANVTVTALMKWYLELKSRKTLSSYDRMKCCLGQFNKVFGDQMVNTIKPIDLENYQAQRKEERRADATVDMEIRIVKTMIKKAFDNGLVGSETIRAFNKVKKLLKRNANTRDRVLSKAEIDALISLLPPHTRAILFIAIHAGMRKNEILSLTWDKVDLKGRMIRLEASDTKDREPRKIPISDELHGLLNSIPKAIHDKHVILYNGKPVRDIRAALKTACKKAGIEYGRFKRGGFILHDARHTFNTNMRRAGVDRSVIMKLTGHTTPEMFERYNTVDESDIKQGINQMESFLTQSVDQSVDQGTENVSRSKQDGLAVTANLLKLNGGSAWESNPPETVLAPHTEFEVREAHQ